MDFLKVKLVNSSTNHVLQFQVDLMVNLLTTEPLDCNEKLYCRVQRSVSPYAKN